jgi:hypothetical protein
MRRDRPTAKRKTNCASEWSIPEEDGTPKDVESRARVCASSERERERDGVLACSCYYIHYSTGAIE